MNDFAEARDIVAALLAVGAAIALILGSSPIKPWFIAAALLLLALSGALAKHRMAVACATLFVLGMRFVFVFAVGRDWRMLAGASGCAACVYLFVKLNPSILDS